MMRENWLRILPQGQLESLWHEALTGAPTSLYVSVRVLPARFTSPQPGCPMPQQVFLRPQEGFTTPQQIFPHTGIISSRPAGFPTLQQVFPRPGIISIRTSTFSHPSAGFPTARYYFHKYLQVFPRISRFSHASGLFSNVPAGFCRWANWPRSHHRLPRRGSRATRPPWASPCRRRTAGSWISARTGRFRSSPGSSKGRDTDGPSRCPRRRCTLPGSRPAARKEKIQLFWIF